MDSLDSNSPQSFQPSHSNWIVLKFGGTSVGKFALSIIEQVVQYGCTVLNFRFIAICYDGLISSN